jgi:hypothetical protein
MAHYIVQDAAAAMPSSCKGRYRRVAVLLVEDGYEHVSMISQHARGVIRVVQTWEKRNVGKTERCAFERAYTEAVEMAKTLNNRLGAKQTLLAWATFGEALLAE